MIIDGDVETLDASARVAEGAIAGGADARAREAAQFLDVEVEELARMVSFVANDGRLNWFQRREPVEAVAAQDAGKRGLGNGTPIWAWPLARLNDASHYRFEYFAGGSAVWSCQSYLGDSYTATRARIEWSGDDTAAVYLDD